MVKSLQEWTSRGHYAIFKDKDDALRQYRVLYDAVLSDLTKAVDDISVDWHKFMESFPAPAHKPRTGYIKIPPLDLAHLSSS